MAETLTTRVRAIKNDDDELVLIEEIDSAFDKFDNHFIPACKIRNSVVQSVPSSSPTYLQYDTTVFDSYAARSEGPMADLANDQIVIRRDGWYKISANIWTTTVSGTGVMRLDIHRNGATIKAAQELATATIITQEVSLEYLLASGDTIKANANQSSGAARNYTNNTIPDGFSLTAVWIGSAVDV